MSFETRFQKIAEKKKPAAEAIPQAPQLNPASPEIQRGMLKLASMCMFSGPAVQSALTEIHTTLTQRSTVKRLENERILDNNCDALRKALEAQGRVVDVSNEVIVAYVLQLKEPVNG